jgi:hypothetical protein
VRRHARAHIQIRPQFADLRVGKLRRALRVICMAMETKTCLDCHERVSAEALKCRFCGFRFDAPAASRSPRWLLVIGVVVAACGGALAMLSVIAAGAIGIGSGLGAMVVQQRARRARRWTATGRHVRMQVPAWSAAIYTTARGYARGAS